MNVLPVSRESLIKGAEILKNGGLTAFPTETVYGLGADAFNPIALAKVFEVKRRPHFDPLIIHIAAIETLEKVCDFSKINEETRKRLFLLAEGLWPGPLSIILPKNERIPGIATSGLETAAIRFPDNKAACELISLSSGAVAAPSANPFGSLSPTRAEHVLSGLGDKVDLILDGGPCRIGVESTVLDITDGNIKILRPGGTPREAIENLIGDVQGKDSREQGVGSNEQGLASPGMLRSHYAPRTPLFIFSREKIIEKPFNADSAYLFYDGCTRDAWKNIYKPPRDAAVWTLCETGDLLEAASNLFETLHEIDKSGALSIIAESAPCRGLGEAINDRLRRGAGI